MMFLKNIVVNDPLSYKTPIITIDIDWAHDEIISDCYSLISSLEVCSTWMVTHNSDFLIHLETDPLCDLGIHPNFNNLLNGEISNGKSAAEIFDSLMELVPNSKVVRSHSITQSSRLSQLFYSRGIEIESNDYLPANQVTNIQPWKLEMGIVKAPYFFSDELACLSVFSEPCMKKLFNRSGLKVFTFHPIHVFLNTECLERYERTRTLHHNPKELIKHRYHGYGTRSRLIELLQLCVIQ